MGRRCINKFLIAQISAQESRRKKKEYMDSLERKVEILVSENSEYKKTIVNLEESNGSLVQQLQKLQKLLAMQATQIVSLITRQFFLSINHFTALL